MNDKASVKIVIEVEYDLNSVPINLLNSGVHNHISMHIKRFLNAAWEDWNGNDPTINSINVDVNSVEI